MKTLVDMIQSFLTDSKLQKALKNENININSNNIEFQRSLKSKIFEEFKHFFTKTLSVVASSSFLR